MPTVIVVGTFLLLVLILIALRNAGSKCTEGFNDSKHIKEVQVLLQKGKWEKVAASYKLAILGGLDQINCITDSVN
ncbi:hypothetical protein, partial [Anaerobaca lacustris]|nr:hypothetical protein [Sedimentisphaerales bacterium M17dextr]